MARGGAADHAQGAELEHLRPDSGAVGSQVKAKTSPGVRRSDSGFRFAEGVPVPHPCGEGTA